MPRGGFRNDKQRKAFFAKLNSGRVNKNKIKKLNQSRSKKSLIADNSKKARVTKDYKKWAKDPSRYDIEGVDTPKKRESEIIARDKIVESKGNINIMKKTHFKNNKKTKVEYL